MTEKKRLSLSFRVFSNIFILLAVILLMGGISVWHAFQYKTMVSHLVDKDIAALEAARGMQTALANHKGFATYYFLDADPKWLEQLRQQRHDFQNWLNEAYGFETTMGVDALLDEIKVQYDNYIYSKDLVISLYKEGLREKGKKEHWAVRSQFFELNDLCRQYEERI